MYACSTYSVCGISLIPFLLVIGNELSTHCGRVDELP